MVERARRADAAPDCRECGASHVFVDRSPTDQEWFCNKCESGFDSPSDYRADGGQSEDADLPERLYYSTGQAASTRRLHRTADCLRLKSARSVHSCPATHPPRGVLCQECFPELSLARLQTRLQAASTEGSV